MYRGLYRTSYARLSRGSVTDTELQIGQFYVPPRGTTLNETRATRYLRRRKEELPTAHVRENHIMPIVILCSVY